MEVEGGSDKKFTVMIYEAVGTCILTYTALITVGNAAAIQAVYFCLLFLCWEMSGGHFNPALTISMFVGQKKFA